MIGPCSSLRRSYAEQEELKSAACRTSPLGMQNHLPLETNFEEHPSFDDYATGVMASEKHAPGFIRDNEEMRRRFPPRLAWIGFVLVSKTEGRATGKTSRRSQQRERLLYAAIHAEDEAVMFAHTACRCQSDCWIEFVQIRRA